MSMSVFQASLTEEMEAIIQNKGELSSILRTENRPISVSLCNAAIRKAQEFKAVLSGFDIEGKVHVAHKATSSLSLISALRKHASIDVASEHELTNALNAGFHASQIIATGPKSNRFLSKLVDLQHTTIVIDSPTELKRLAAISANIETSILLRLTRTLLNIPSIGKVSRFGLDRAGIDEALAFIDKTKHIQLRGVAYHLDSESLEERQYATQKAINILLSIQADFPTALILDIGGGYGADYGVSASDIERYDTLVKQMLTSNEDSPFVWQKRSFGISYDGSRVRGGLSGVDVFRDEVGAKRLKKILDYRGDGNMTLAAQISENLLELWIEPGSSIFSAAGVAAAEIIDIYKRDGQNFIVVDAHRNQIAFEGNEHVADPLLLSVSDASKTAAFESFVVGHLCMEADFMQYRKIVFPAAPQVGDMLVWLHTGAYRSHFSASNAIGHPDAARYTFINNTFSKDTT